MRLASLLPTIFGDYLKKYMNEAFPSGDPQPGIFTAELALGFDSSVDIEDTAERGSNKSHHKLYETDTDKTTCDNIRSCLESQDVNQYDEIKRTFVWRNSKDYHYIDLEKPILLKHMITFAGIGFLNRGALGALVGGAIGVFTGTFDATFNINYHQNSNMAARLMVEKCITKFTGNKPSKEWWWIVPGWGLEFS